MNGNVAFVGLNFQERVEEEHLKKEGNNGEAYWVIRARDLIGAIEPVFSTLTLTLRAHAHNEKLPVVWKILFNLSGNLLFCLCLIILNPGIFTPLLNKPNYCPITLHVYITEYCSRFFFSR